MEKTKRVQLFEVTLYAIILVAVLSIPFFTGAFARRGWEGICFEWLRILPFLLIFLTNNYLLVPQLLFKEKYAYYLAGCLLLITISVFLSDFLFDLNRMLPPPFENMPHKGMLPIGDGFPQQGGPPCIPFDSKGHLHFNAGQIIIAFLLIGFNTGLKIFVRYTKEQMNQAEKERQHLFTELAFLKYQISPHFFMNTLNNIHALVDINGERAKDAIVKLSKMMRYMLYESEPEKVSLKKEVEFIESYIELMRLRYDESDVEITFTYPQETEHIKIPAFLFLSFIENAFKHGILAGGKSFIRLSFSIHENRLIFSMKNSIGNQRDSMNEASGIGIDNIKKRLYILYKDECCLKIQENATDFSILLNIPL